jgi:hypothetical protein
MEVKKRLLSFGTDELEVIKRAQEKMAKEMGVGRMGSERVFLALARRYLEN